MHSNVDTHPRSFVGVSEKYDSPLMNIGGILHQLFCGMTQSVLDCRREDSLAVADNLIPFIMAHLDRSCDKPSTYHHVIL